MALIGSIAINMALQTKAFAAGIDRARKKLNDFGTGLASIKGLVAGALFGGAAAGIGKLISAASDLNETISKTRAVFGDGADDIIADADRMAQAFGISKNEFLGAASTLGGLFKGVGYDSKQAALLSGEMTKLAVDVSSFANIPFQAAFDKLRSGLTGESEPLKSLGVMINETAVKAEAMRLGIARGNTELTEAQKVQARLSLITSKLKDAQGDYAKTADGVANSTRSLSGRIENLSATLGTVLLPIASQVLGQLQVGAEVLSMAWDDWGNTAVASAKSAVGGIGETAMSMGYLQKAIGFVADAWQILGLGFQAVQSYVTYGLGVIVSGLANLGSAIDFIVEKLTGVKSGLGDFLKTYGDDLNNLSNKQWAQFQKDLAKPPSSEGINEYFKKAQDKIKKLQKEAVKPGVDVSKITPANAPAAKVGMPKFASAAVAGTREATNAILRGMFGAGVGKTAADQTAKNTGRTAKAVEDLAAAMRQAKGAPGSAIKPAAQPNAWAGF